MSRSRFTPYAPRCTTERAPSTRTTLRAVALLSPMLLVIVFAFVHTVPEVAAGDHIGETVSGEHPEKAVCRTCAMRGSQHGEEPVRAVREWKDRYYYFCAEGCAEAFDQFPAAYEVKEFPRPAPSAVVERLGGTVLILSDLTSSGNVVLIDFWATWCKPCTKSMPKLQKLHENLAGKGLHVLGISIDEKGRDHVGDFLGKKEYTYDMVVDSGESPAWFHYGVPAVPAMFLIDRRGQIVAEWKGLVEIKEIQSTIEELLEASEG